MASSNEAPKKQEQKGTTSQGKSMPRPQTNQDDAAANVKPEWNTGMPKAVQGDGDQGPNKLGGQSAKAAANAGRDGSINNGSVAKGANSVPEAPTTEIGRMKDYGMEHPIYGYNRPDGMG